MIGIRRIFLLASIIFSTGILEFSVQTLPIHSLPQTQEEFFFPLQSNYMFVFFLVIIFLLFLFEIRDALSPDAFHLSFMLCRSPLLSVYADMSVTCKVKVVLKCFFLTHSHLTHAYTCVIKHKKTRAEFCNILMQTDIIYSSSI